jgi:tetratricopeptide (TPR) repeat protein
MNILSFFRDRSLERAKILYQRGRRLIDEKAYDEALDVARRLRKVRYSGAFEIEGMAYAGLGRDEDAVRMLREGLQSAPAIWLNWHQLGTCLSNLGRYDEALLAYDRAEACPQSDRSVIELNRAVVAIRTGDFAAALAHLDRIQAYDSAGMRIAAIAFRVSALHGLGRDAEAEELVADDEAEARALIIELEGAELTIDSATAIEPRADSPHGVYAVTGRVYYKET